MRKIPVSAAKMVVLILFITAVACTREEDKVIGNVSDYEGNEYSTVRIGDQVWMAGNLRSTVLNDGTPITLAPDSASWSSLSTPGYSWYNNDITNKETYGALYNGYAIDSNRLCPSGWHVPSKDEWQQLITFLGDSLEAGAKMKEKGTLHWRSPNTGADNSSGFSAFGAGVRYFEGSFYSLTEYSAIWSATDAGENDLWFSGLYYGNSAAYMQHRGKNYGLSVRCIRDH